VLVEDERVKAITFTGSGGVGWGLKERAPKKKVSLELGNATPVIVTADADVEATAAAMAANAFAFAGQSCISVQRIYVERPAYDRFVEAFLPRVSELKVGDPGLRGHRRRAGDRRRREGADPRVGRGGEGQRRRGPGRRRGAGRPDPARR
jgi:acyl-CoA reductase-like NAD-dependent aldehyde dehydrogenase